MRLAVALSTLLLALGACAEAPSGAESVVAEIESAAAPAAPGAVQVVRAVRALPAGEIWPGFRPDTIPLALFDGRATYLVGFAEPPAGFERSSSGAGVLVQPGRHPAVRANRYAEIGGRTTATLLLDGLAGSTPEEAASVAVHEKFHVFQDARHPDWSANELARFACPVEDIQLLFHRRFETRALSRALEASEPADVVCWLNTALALRERRMTLLPPQAAQYERAVERTEGLARYVELRSIGDATVELTESGYAPEAIRERAYATGVTLAFMLDRLSPDWKAMLEERGMPLDSMLRHALGQRPASSCGFTAGEREDVFERASAAIEVTRANQASDLRAFEAQPGWRIRFVAEGAEPLWPRSFDPMNVQQLGSGRLLHQRMLRLANDHGEIDVYDRPALSRGTGGDPLMQGVRQVVLTGFEQRPAVEAAGDSVRISAPGLRAAFGRARIGTEGQELLVRVP